MFLMAVDDNAPKSSVELAMERLRKRDADAGIEQLLLTDEQKTAITEIRNFLRGEDSRTGNPPGVALAEDF